MNDTIGIKVLPVNTSAKCISIFRNHSSLSIGEIKKLSTSRLLLFDEDLMTFSMGNAIVSEDTNGNRKLCKFRRDAKIDNVSALMDALVAYKENKEAFE